MIKCFFSHHITSHYRRPNQKPNTQQRISNRQSVRKLLDTPRLVPPHHSLGPISRVHLCGVPTISRVHERGRGGGDSERDTILRCHAFDIFLPVFWNTEFATPVREGDEEVFIVSRTERDVLETLL
jgi:hypothetical protein